VKGAWIVLGGWGLLIVAFATVQLVFSPRASEIALLAGSGAVVVLGGVAALVAERRRRPRRAASGELMRWTSASTVTLAVGICVFALGWNVGAWCIAIGAGLSAVGLFGVVREIRAERR
jgi:hypothetical protein